MSERRPVGRIVRVFRVSALVLVLAAAIVAACDSSTDAPPAASTVDPGPTFGIEVTISVSGNGRVVSAPLAIDCPSNCFARITSADRAFDGSDIGMTLTASAGLGSHFVGWSGTPFVSGTRAQGPAECSPMTRNAIGPPIGPIDETVLLPYGETQGTPPKGREAECAPYTTVPVAFALAATFAEDPAQTFFGDDASPPGEVLFEPPALGVVVAQEIAVLGDKIYLRYDQNSMSSAIVSGPKDGKSGLTTLLSSDTTYRNVSFGPHIAAQDQNLAIQTLNLTTQARGSVALGVACTGLATDDTAAYCRFTSGGQSFLYATQLDGLSSLRYIYSLPLGSDLAVDDASIYYSEVPTSGGALGSATMETATKSPDASGLPDSSRLVPGLNNPSHLIATGTDLLWLDLDETFAASIVSHAPKTGADAATAQRFSAANVAIVSDRSHPQTFYVATAPADVGGAQIIRFGIAGPVATVLSGIPNVNGLAVDDTYLYWTQNDGRVYRAPKP